VGIVSAVAESCVGWTSAFVDAKVLPCGKVIVCYAGVVRCIRGIASQLCNDSHRFNANHAFEC
jgi:hypothetical protein